MKRLLSLLFLLCAWSCTATTAVLDLKDVRINPGVYSNRSCYLQPLSTPTISTPSVVLGSRIFFSTDTNGVYTFTNLYTGLYAITVTAPPQREDFAFLITATNLGTINVADNLVAASTATFPAGSVAWAAAVTDQRYARGSNAPVTYSQVTNALGFVPQIGTVTLTNYDPSLFVGRSNSFGTNESFSGTNAFSGKIDVSQVNTIDVNVLLGTDTAGKYVIAYNAGNGITFLGASVALAQNGATNGQVQAWNGVQWSPITLTIYQPASANLTNWSLLSTNVLTGLAQVAVAAGSNIVATTNGLLITVNGTTDTNVHNILISQSNSLNGTFQGNLLNATNLPISGLKTTGSALATTFLAGDGSWKPAIYSGSANTLLGVDNSGALIVSYGVGPGLNVTGGNLYLTSFVTTQGNVFNAAGDLLQLDGSGNVPMDKRWIYSLNGVGTNTGIWGTNQSTWLFAVTPSGPSTGQPMIFQPGFASALATNYWTFISPNNWWHFDGLIDGSSVTNINTTNIVTGVMATARLGTGTANNTTFLRGDQTWATPSGTGSTGTVVAVGLAMPLEFTVSGSPVTGAGTNSAAWNNENGNFVMAGPANGLPGTPGFRALVAADIPTLPITSWQLNGNAGAVPPGSFIGTTDANSLLFKVNSGQAAFLSGSGKIIVGDTSDTIAGDSDGIYSAINGTISVTGSGGHNVLLGGNGNTISGSTGLGGVYSAIIGGQNNKISSSLGSPNQDVILGGSGNIATGTQVTIAGFNDVGAGVSDFVGGAYARTTNNGVFIWSDDSTTTPFYSVADNTFNVRASGGVRFVTGGAGISIDGGITNTSGYVLFTNPVVSGVKFTNTAPGRLLVTLNYTLTSTNGFPGLCLTNLVTGEWFNATNSSTNSVFSGRTDFFLSPNDTLIVTNRSSSSAGATLDASWAKVQ